MILDIKVIPKARFDKVERQEDGSYRVWTSEIPEKGKANDAVRKLLAEHFGVSVSSVEIQQTTSRKKKATINNINA